MIVGCVAGKRAVEAIVWVRRVWHTSAMRGGGICAGHKQGAKKTQGKRTSSAMVMDCVKESGRVLKKRRQRDVTMPKGRLQKKGRKRRGEVVYTWLR